jgi:hypothetical protein
MGDARVAVREVRSIMRHETTNIYDVQHGKPKPEFADVEALIVEHTTEIKQISKTIESNH